MLLTDLLLRSGKNSAELAVQAMHQFPQVLVNVPVASGSLAITADIQKEIDITEQRLGRDGRVLVRPSGTEAVVRVMVEAADEAVAQDEAQHLANMIRSAIG